MVTARERVARAWHAGSDHAKDDCPFGGPLCNCWQVAGRMLPMLRKAWDDCAEEAWWNGHLGSGEFEDMESRNPYKAKEDRHVDQ